MSEKSKNLQQPELRLSKSEIEKKFIEQLQYENDLNINDIDQISLNSFASNDHEIEALMDKGSVFEYFPANQQQSDQIQGEDTQLTSNLQNFEEIMNKIEQKKNELKTKQQKDNLANTKEILIINSTECSPVKSQNVTQFQELKQLGSEKKETSQISLTNQDPNKINDLDKNTLEIEKQKSNHDSESQQELQDEKQLPKSRQSQVSKLRLDLVQDEWQNIVQEVWHEKIDHHQLMTQQINLMQDQQDTIELTIDEILFSQILNTRFKNIEKITAFDLNLIKYKNLLLDDVKLKLFKNSIQEFINIAIVNYRLGLLDDALKLINKLNEQTKHMTPVQLYQVQKLEIITLIRILQKGLNSRAFIEYKQPLQLAIEYTQGYRFVIEIDDKDEVVYSTRYRFYLKTFKLLSSYQQNEYFKANEFLQFLIVINKQEQLIGSDDVFDILNNKLMKMLEQEEHAIGYCADQILAKSQNAYLIYQFIKLQIQISKKSDKQQDLMHQLIQVSKFRDIPDNLKIKIYLLIIKLSSSVQVFSICKKFSNRLYRLSHLLKDEKKSMIKFQLDYFKCDSLRFSYHDNYQTHHHKKSSLNYDNPFVESRKQENLITYNSQQSDDPFRNHSYLKKYETEEAGDEVHDDSSIIVEDFQAYNEDENSVELIADQIQHRNKIMEEIKQQRASVNQVNEIIFDEQYLLYIGIGCYLAEQSQYLGIICLKMYIQIVQQNDRDQKLKIAMLFLSALEKQLENLNLEQSQPIYQMWMATFKDYLSLPIRLPQEIEIAQLLEKELEKALPNIDGDMTVKVDYF
ncbi:UNKNOWN [Stylonychia lemnae]|uniref:Uncharacterized protein n=1 Tax=Stylonychia lemnae TaxID=5949 RepID=A0A078A8E0_STYLE|nr:UNKNOWN [Stylonychia lemnae]|eukprot:CDW77837.1 UNKNOWN [Stylonychia lemnae]